MGWSDKLLQLSRKVGAARRVQGDWPWTAGKKEMGTLILVEAGILPAKAQAWEADWEGWAPGLWVTRIPGS